MNLIDYKKLTDIMEDLYDVANEYELSITEFLFVVRDLEKRLEKQKRDYDEEMELEEREEEVMERIEKIRKESMR